MLLFTSYWHDKRLMNSVALFTEKLVFEVVWMPRWNVNVTKLFNLLTKEMKAIVFNIS